MRVEITNKVIEMILHLLPYLNEADIRTQTYLGKNGLGMESMSFLELLVKVQQEFNIVIDDDYWDIRELSCVQKIVDYIIQKMDISNH